jgi:hypothetical protein
VPAATSYGSSYELRAATTKPYYDLRESEPAAGRWSLVVGAAFTFFYTLQSRPAVVLFVYLYAKSTIPNAQHDSGDIL